MKIAEKLLSKEALIQKTYPCFKLGLTCVEVEISMKQENLFRWTNVILKSILLSHLYTN